MGAGVSPEVIARAGLRARQKFGAKLREIVDPHSDMISAKGVTTVSFRGGIEVDVAFKVIRASNSEAAGWPIADLKVNGHIVGRFHSPPWLDGCKPENVAPAVQRLLLLNSSA
jgi:hypothetical protein